MAATAKNTSQNEKKTFDDFPHLKKMLPPNYDYYFESYNECEPLEGEQRFTASFRIDQNAATKGNVRQWIDRFCSHSLTTYRIDRTYPSETTWYVYRVDLRCQHNTKPTSHKRVQTPHKKHTACPAKMIVKIRQARLSRRKRHETQLKTHPVEVILYHQHNHPILQNEMLKYRDPDLSLVEKFHKMYQAGYKPSAALEIHKRNLRLEYEDSFHSVVEDRGLCPDINWCYRQFDIASKTSIDADITNLQMKTLHEYVCDYNERCGEICAAMKLLNEPNGNIVVALLSPLMRSAHVELKCSAKFMLIDSLEIEYLRCKVYMLMTHNGSCKLPLGALITTSDSTCVLQEALSLYAELLPERGFCGRGLSGPSVVMVEDDENQCKVMKEIFPLASLFPSPYHIIQRAWAYLCESECDLLYSCRAELIETLKSALCSEKEEDFENCFEKLNLILAKTQSSEFSSHIQILYTKKHEWAPCFRKDLQILFDNGMEMIKNCLNSIQERYFSRHSSCTMIELLDFLTGNIEQFYKERLRKYVDGEYDEMLSLQYSKDKEVPDVLEIVPYFKVRNASNGLYYDVDMRLGLCSCPQGKDGNPCQHQYAIIQNINVGTLLNRQTRDKEVNEEVMEILNNLSNWPETNNAVVNDADMADVSSSSRNAEPSIQVCHDGFHGDEMIEHDKSSVNFVTNTNRTTNEIVEMRDGLLSLVSADPEVQVSTETSLPLENDNRDIMNEDDINIAKPTKNQYFPCRICGKTLLSSSQLVRHQKLHNHNKPVVCDICGLGYKSKECLKNHYARNHSGKKTFECEVCGKKFKRLGNVARHRKEHRVKNLECSHCSDVFTAEEDLSDHVNNVHGEGPPNIILEVKNQMPCPLQLQRQEIIKEIIIIDTEGQLPFHV